MRRAIFTAADSRRRAPWVRSSRPTARNIGNRGPA